MDMGLNDKVVFITGGSRGIGKACALQFAEEGAKVVISYASNREAADDTVRQITERGYFCKAVRLDFKSLETIPAALDEIVSTAGKVEVLVNNAAAMVGNGPVRAEFDTASIDEWFDLIQLNLYPTAYVTRSIVPMMKEAGWGRIVHISSGAATDGFAGGSSYTSYKAALHGFSKTLALELSPSGVYSNVIMPGFTVVERHLARISPEQMEVYATNHFTKRLGKPEDVATLAVYLGSAANRHISGEIIRVSGGK
ncbi:SDR family oxidoreductase [Paenibacillus sp. P26]|nr:SDR family oxidoreductase [Paenibacillus sp. P26]UUZ91777.1 SDR family oxidoreductase [Paenibacillus sp. P25]